MKTVSEMIVLTRGRILKTRELTLCGIDVLGAPRTMDMVSGFATELAAADLAGEVGESHDARNALDKLLIMLAVAYATVASGANAFNVRRIATGTTRMRFLMFPTLRMEALAGDFGEGRPAPALEFLNNRILMDAGTIGPDIGYGEEVGGADPISVSDDPETGVIRPRYSSVSASMSEHRHRIREFRTAAMTRDDWYVVANQIRVDREGGGERPPDKATPPRPRYYAFPTPEFADVVSALIRLRGGAWLLWSTKDAIAGALKERPLTVINGLSRVAELEAEVRRELEVFHTHSGARLSEATSQGLNAFVNLDWEN